MDSSKRRKVLVCTCERSMPDYGDSVARGCRGAEVESGNQLCGAELDRVRAMLAGAEAVTIGCTQQAPLFTEVAEDLGFAGELAFANIRETGGWSDAGADAGPKAAALMAMAAETSAAPSLVTLSSGGVVADLRPRRDGDRGGPPARRPARRDRAALPAGGGRAAPGLGFPGDAGDDPQRQGPSRRLRARRRRLRRARALVARRAPVRRGARRGGLARRHRARPLRRRSALSGARPARRLCPRRPPRPGGGRRGALEGGRSRRRVRQAALHRLLPRALRPFALAHHRLHPLPRALPDRRDHPGRRPRRDRRRGLRRLRQLRRRLPDRRRRLRGAERRGAAAAAPHAPSHLLRAPAARTRSCSSTTPATASR